MTATCSLRLRELMLVAFFNQDAASLPVSLFASLCTDVALVGSSGSDLIEPTTGGYARIELPLISDYWATTGFGQVYNTIDVDFPPPTEDWGLIQGWALTDSVIGGDLLMSGSMIMPSYLLAGMPPPSLPIGLVTIGLFD